MAGEKTCERLFKNQFGVISRKQALGAGLSRSTIALRLKQGRWKKVSFGRAKNLGLYTVPTIAGSLNRKRMMALLLLGDDCALSHATAAAVHGWITTAEIHVMTTKKITRMEGVLLHRVEVLPDWRRVSGFPVVVPEEALLGLAAHGSKQLLASVYEAVRNEQTTLQRVLDHLAKATEQRREGVKALREVVHGGDLPHRSVLEARAFAVVQDANLIAPLPLYPLVLPDGRRIEADFCWPNQRVIVEIDSFLFHSSPEALTKDRDRQNQIIAAGWTLLRYTWPQLRDSPHKVTDELAHFVPKVQGELPLQG